MKKNQIFRMHYHTMRIVEEFAKEIVPSRQNLEYGLYDFLFLQIDLLTFTWSCVAFGDFVHAKERFSQKCRIHLTFIAFDMGLHRRRWWSMLSLTNELCGKAKSNRRLWRAKTQVASKFKMCSQISSAHFSKLFWQV